MPYSANVMNTFNPLSMDFDPGGTRGLSKSETEEKQALMRMLASATPAMLAALGTGTGALAGGLASGGNPAAIGAGASAGGALGAGGGQGLSIGMHELADSYTRKEDQENQKKLGQIQAIKAAASGLL